MPKLDKKYDITLLGATGFTGALTADYLVRAQAREKFSLALAGRSLKKLNGVKRRLKEQGLDCSELALIKADVRQQSSMNRLAEQTRLVISTVGPYVQHGEPVIRACVQNAADYVDLTGEAEFVDFIQRKFHSEAKAKGLRIVNCCGFDSIPHDLGALFAVHELAKHINADEPLDGIKNEVLNVQGFVSASADFSGGTWHSVINAMRRHTKYLREQRYWHKHAPASYPHSSRVVKALPMNVRYQSRLQAWSLPLPSIDPQIVLRSARAMDIYGARFEYGHHVLFKHLPKALVSAVALGGVFALAQMKVSRNWLLGMKSQGQGPDQVTRDASWFKVDMQVQSSQHFLQAEISGGDPGYTETAKMLAESALCLALDDRENSHVGVITPAVAMGQALIARLQRAGIVFKVVELR